MTIDQIYEMAVEERIVRLNVSWSAESGETMVSYWLTQFPNRGVHALFNLEQERVLQTVRRIDENTAVLVSYSQHVRKYLVH